ncbi:MAG: bifunctional folylpolyglutamate synthase/dihydrofolate synthase [Sphingomonadales bacterium]|nr:bifunctional folylpolyglutamate synthase/dihydrofolate synthase [Sphingomonadales bacterium]
MRDFAVSENAAVQRQLDRLAALSLPQGRFGLDTIKAILARLGDPQLRLPPVFHVAGTNGKGSTCAYLRAILEAQGYTVHSATKPHLVRYNERIRLAGKLIGDDELATLLQQVLDASADLGPSFFEVTTAAMFLAFANHPADAAIVEVGLGGRFDATNVIPRPAACGIAALGIDHEAFLLRPEPGTPEDPLARIAFEKASIARPGAPLVTQAYPRLAMQTVAQTARALGAELFARNQSWRAEITDHIAYADAFGPLTLPLPTLPGTHQAENAALAVAMLRHQDALPVSPEAIAAGITAARWPARLQRLNEGPLTRPGQSVFIDGGHNADATQAIARAIAPFGPVDLIFGLMANRPAADVLGPLLPHVSKLLTVPLPGHDCHAPEALAALADGTACPGLEAALALATAPTVLIAGSLYLAGEALRLNDEIPD